jgi:hypothetical protein
MPSFNLPSVSSGADAKELANTIGIMSKELQYLLQNLDNANIKSITADKITAGVIDASKIDVINLNASNISTGTLSAITINGCTITASDIARVNGDLYLGTQGSNAAKNIYFNDYMYLRAKADNGWVIKFGCGILEFIGSMRGEWYFNTGTIGGLEPSGYYTFSDIQDWAYSTFRTI